MSAAHGGKAALPVLFTALSCKTEGFVNQRLNFRTPDLSQSDPAQWAALALDFGVQALSEAERDGATPGEILRLCDEVIVRRLQVQMLRIQSGWRAPAELITQMDRDRQLLAQPVCLDD